MFSWTSLAKTPLSARGTTYLLGYSQTIMNHHFVMAARFFKTLKNKVRVTATVLLPGPFGILCLVTLFFLPDVRFLLFALCIVQGRDVSLGSQQFLRLVFRLAVFCVGLLLPQAPCHILYRVL